MPQSSNLKLGAKKKKAKKPTTAPVTLPRVSMSPSSGGKDDDGNEEEDSNTTRPFSRSDEMGYQPLSQQGSRKFSRRGCISRQISCAASGHLSDAAADHSPDVAIRGSPEVEREVKVSIKMEEDNPICSVLPFNESAIQESLKQLEELIQESKSSEDFVKAAKLSNHQGNVYKKLQHLKICEENVRAAKEQVMLALHQAGGDR